MKNIQFCHAALVVSVSVLIAACGNGSSGSNPGGSKAVTYNVGGSVSGLAGSGLVLQNNGGDNLAVKQSGAFTFSSPVDGGSAYKVTVLTQPSDPTQTCVVSNGSGTASANVSVSISCTTVTFTVAGSVQGLVGVGLVLQDNLANDLSITANGSFAFATPVDGGTPYSVTVLAQPAAPSQTCSPSNASGTANANVTGVSIVCTNNNPVGQWTWVGGSDMTNQPGIYTAPGAVPGARYNAVTWRDSSGNTFWLFGGNGYDSQGHSGDLNDLWSYSGGEWTSMSSSTALNQSGVYGTEKIAASANTPGSRQSAVTWSDSSGNFWLFGGSGGDSAGTIGYLNDLWKYSGGEWTWISGSKTADQSGSYGTKGKASTTNVPASRSGAVEWTDAAGNFWIFGGFAVGSNGQGNLNDLWKYGTDGEWTWVAGSNTIDQAGNYGSLGKAASTNMPGSRNSAMGWIDSSGNLWLFGGEGSDTNGQQGDLNDMWKYSPSTGQWTWITGNNTQGQEGYYGTEGTAASKNIPGSRDSAVALTDASGNFWLFGGNGDASTTTRGSLNDIWEYTGGQWIWMSGSNAANEKGTYGVEGKAAADNIPGGRGGAVGWIDAAGGIWIFGGAGYDSQGNSGDLNDLWTYQP